MAEATPEASDIEAAIAARVRSLRAGQGLTLDGLAARSGVSRAMLSRIERGESSPTAGLLLKLCDGLGVTLAELLGHGGPDAARAGRALARRADQPVWRDSGSGYLRRAVSPGGAGGAGDADGGGSPGRVAIVEVELPAGAAVVFDPLDRAGDERCIWALTGGVAVSHGDAETVLAAGDCLRVARDGPLGLRAPGPEAARCAVVTGRAGDAPQTSRMPT